MRSFRMPRTDLGVKARSMNKRLSALFIALFLASTGTNEVHAVSVASGCAVPKSPPERRAFYVDPVTGNMSNDGSITRPWKTLAEVLDNSRKLIATQTHPANYQRGDQRLINKNPSAPIKPGDIIYLNSGDHGHVQLVGAINKEFITVQAAPGQTPALRSLIINGASKWLLVGLKIQGESDGSGNSTSNPALIQFGRNQWFGPTTNIVFAGNSVSTTDDTSAWSNEDWVRKPFTFGIFSSANCVSISGNHFFNLRNALQFDGDHHLVFDNNFDNFGNDAIEVVAGNATIRNNRIIKGRHTKSEPLHPDGIQGWTRPGVTNTNVVIDGNIIIKTGDPQVTEMQGIGIFDGKWNGLTITNNVVITNHWHGISISGVENAKIINNTVLAYDPISRPTWISVNKAKDGTLPKNVIVRNNITTRLVYTEEGVTADHNLVAKMITTSVQGKPIYVTKPGIFGNHNSIDPNIYDGLTRVDHSKELYDLRLKPSSPALGNGNPDQAPNTDILGKQRKPPIDIGAYAR